MGRCIATFRARSSGQLPRLESSVACPAVALVWPEKPLVCPGAGGGGTRFGSVVGTQSSSGTFDKAPSFPHALPSRGEQVLLPACAVQARQAMGLRVWL